MTKRKMTAGEHAEVVLIAVFVGAICAAVVAVAFLLVEYLTRPQDPPVPPPTQSVSAAAREEAT